MNGAIIRIIAIGFKLSVVEEAFVALLNTQRDLHVSYLVMANNQMRLYTINTVMFSVLYTKCGRYVCTLTFSTRNRASSGYKISDLVCFCCLESKSAARLLEKPIELTNLPLTFVTLTRLYLLSQMPKDRFFLMIDKCLIKRTQKLIQNQNVYVNWNRLFSSSV